MTKRCGIGGIVLAAASAATMACSTGSIAPDLAGSQWRLAVLEDSVLATAPEATPYVQFAEAPQRVSGMAGCNVLSGAYERSGQALSFGLLALTKRMCEPQRMELESRFMQVLGGVTRYTVREGVLLLYAGDRLVAQLQRSG